MVFDKDTGIVITQQEATTMMDKYQQGTSSGEVKAVSYGANHYNNILAQPDCIGIANYFGIDSEAKKTLVLVGVDKNGNGMWGGIILEWGANCPPFCPNPII